MVKSHFIPFYYGLRFSLSTTDLTGEIKTQIGTYPEDLVSAPEEAL